MCVAFVMQHWVVRHGAEGIGSCPLESENSSYLIHSLAVSSTAIWAAKGILLTIMCTSSAKYSICTPFALHSTTPLPSKFILQVPREEGLHSVVADTVEAVYQTLTVYH